MDHSPSRDSSRVAAAAQGEPRIAIVGAGFGGLEVAKALGRAGIGATLVDRQNHHLFQPLLYQVSTAALSAPEIAQPIRSILRRYGPIQVLLAEVRDIDMDARTLRFSDGEQFGFDILVLASGARPGYFGNDAWERFAPGLKTIDDARRIRSDILLNFEAAERSRDPAEQRRLLTFAVVGGGPTGVELAGSIAELARHTLSRDFRNIRSETARIILIEAGERLLAGFSPELSRHAEARLARLGVEIRTRTPVRAIEADRIEVDGETIPAGHVLWAAGVRASPLGAALGRPVDRGGRIEVAEDFSVPGCPGVYALGDVAAFRQDGALLPGLAQVAKQEGIHLGEGLVALLREGRPLRPFRYRSRGNTAIVGRHSAVFEHGAFKAKGWLAWISWAIIHVYLLVGFQARFLVSSRWLWRYLTYEGGARLISYTPAAGSLGPAVAPEAGGAGGEGP